MPNGILTAEVIQSWSALQQDWKDIKLNIEKNTPLDYDPNLFCNTIPNWEAFNRINQYLINQSDNQNQKQACELCDWAKQFLKVEQLPETNIQFKMKIAKRFLEQETLDINSPYSKFWISIVLNDQPFFANFKTLLDYIQNQLKKTPETSSKYQAYTTAYHDCLEQFKKAVQTYTKTYLTERDLEKAKEKFETIYNDTQLLKPKIEQAFENELATPAKQLLNKLEFVINAGMILTVIPWLLHMAFTKNWYYKLENAKPKPPKPIDTNLPEITLRIPTYSEPTKNNQKELFKIADQFNMRSKYNAKGYKEFFAFVHELKELAKHNAIDKLKLYLNVTYKLLFHKKLDNFESAFLQNEDTALSKLVLSHQNNDTWWRLWKKQNLAIILAECRKETQPNSFDYFDTQLKKNAESFGDFCEPTFQEQFANKRKLKLAAIKLKKIKTDP